MTRTLRYAALALWVSLTAATVYAETAAGPPAWNDKASVYLAISQAALAERPAAQATSAPATAKLDSAIIPALQETPAAPAPSEPHNRYLAPPGARLAPAATSAPDGKNQMSSTASHRLAEFGVPMQSMYTVLTALAIVIGAFLLFVWLLKRGSRGSAARRSVLPADVVSVLGRVPLAARQFAELLRVGNKLVLVSLTPTGAETLTEVTDPAEVDRLVGLCQQNNPFSTTKAFEQVFQQMSSEPAPGGFFGNDSLMPSLASPAGAYRANRGAATRG